MRDEPDQSIFHVTLKSRRRLLLRLQEWDFKNIVDKVLAVGHSQVQRERVGR
jgi:hypothetical protein